MKTELFFDTILKQNEFSILFVLMLFTFNLDHKIIYNM